MARRGEPPHPNVLSARKSPEACRLSANPQAAAERRAQIHKMRESGKSVAEIAQHFLISRARVYQLLKKPNPASDVPTPTSN